MAKLLQTSVTATAAEINSGCSGLLATAAELNRAADVSTRIVAVTATPLVLVEATHEGKVVTLSATGGIAVTLPAATGSGAKYTFVVVTTTTSTSAHVFTVTGNDTICGHGLADDGDGEPANGWSTTNATTATFGGTNNASGGVKGDIIEFIDVAADLWFCRFTGTNGGTEATPFA